MFYFQENFEIKEFLNSHSLWHVSFTIFQKELLAFFSKLCKYCVKRDCLYVLLSFCPSKSARGFPPVVLFTLLE